jgi:hypothetical protein
VSDFSRLQMTTRARLRSLGAVTLSVLCALACSATRAHAATGTFVASNCAPVAAASDGTMVWYSRNAAGLWDAYIGAGNCQGAPLLPAYAGNRGPADITPDGRYVLLTTAVGWEKALPPSAPGRGSQNAIQLYDRQTGRLSTLLAGATTSQRGVIWPRFNADGTQIAWSQMVRTAAEAPPVGQWALHVADVNLAAGTLTHNVEWQDPNGEPAFYEGYGWIPGTHQLIFMSTTRATSTSFASFGKAQLFTLPDTLPAGTPPTRISPQFAPVWSWQSAVDVYHEFANFVPGAPNTLYTSIAADTLGGDDLFSYDLRTQQANGLLGQPTRISYFGGDLNRNWGMRPIPGWPQPSYTVVTTMAWVNGAWVAATCPGMACETVNAWRIDLNAVAGAPAVASASPAQAAYAAPQSPPSQPAGSGRPAAAHATAGLSKKKSKRACRASASGRARGARGAAKPAARSRCAAKARPKPKRTTRHGAR